MHILLISFKITVYSYIVAGIKSGTKIGINPNKISRFIFTKKDGKTMKKKKEKAEELKLQVEVWMISIPFWMQRTIK